MEIKDFEGALKRLEEIVKVLESGSLPLEEAIKLFEEGMKLTEFCTRKLDEAEKKVQLLIKNEKGMWVKKDMEEAIKENDGGEIDEGA